MSKRRAWTYTPGTHLALRTETGYKPAMILLDNGRDEPMVKVRYTTKGVIRDEWVFRENLVPPPWCGPRRS